MGGGTTVNWACCIPLPTYVREEWADSAGTHKLPQFAPPTPSAVDKGEQPSKATADGSDGAEGPVAGKAGAPEATEYDKALAAVMQRIGASKDGVTHDAGNQILLGGAAKLGYAATATAQNFDAPSAPSAGWTCFGDRCALPLSLHPALSVVSFSHCSPPIVTRKQTCTLVCHSAL